MLSTARTRNHRAMRTRTSAEVLAGHISDKNGRRGNIPPNALAVLETAFSLAMTVMDKGGRMERRRVGGFEIRGVYVDFFC